MTTELVKSEERANSSEPVAERTTLDEPLPRERRYKLSEKIIATQDIHRGYTLVYNLRRCRALFAAGPCSPGAMSRRCPYRRGWFFRAP